MLSPCNQPLPPSAALGLRLFNSGRYFEAHEALEHAWLDEPTEIRDLYRGILQAAVVYLHITRRNYSGALKVFERSKKWLNKWPEKCRGIDVQQLRLDLQAAANALHLLVGRPDATLDRGFLKPVRWGVSAVAARREFLCDRCGHPMLERNCRVVCTNCGNFFDCSDLNLNFD